MRTRTGLTLLILLLLAANLSAQEHTAENGFPPGYFSGDPLPPSTIYLTFDDGPSPETGHILDILHDKGVRATFFINAFDRNAPASEIGKKNNLLPYRELLRRMVADGHVIGNHTFSHRDLATLNASQIAWQLDRVQQCLDAALGSEAPRMTLIRPPFGSPWNGRWGTLEQRRRTADLLAARGFVMNWTDSWDSSDSIDWVVGESQRLNGARFVPSMEYLNKQNREMRRLLAHADGQTSAVVLFHDTHPTVLDVLGPVIDKYKALGYTFETLDHYAAWRWPEVPAWR